MSTCIFPTVVTVAGTDPSGGAGIQADIKAISATGSYAASIITALVAQNTQGVQGFFPVSPDFVRQQFNSVFSDLDVDAVKMGMLHDEAIIEVVFSELNKFKQKQVVFDPVMVAKGGANLLKPSAMETLKHHLRGAAYLITPNLMEAEQLLGSPISNQSDMSQAAKQLAQTFELNVLIKGGHLSTVKSPDVLYIQETGLWHWFDGSRISTKNTHGTGCTLSSAIASYLAQGYLLHPAIAAAKTYLTQALRSAAVNQVGKGHGPVDHFYFLDNRQALVLDSTN